MRRRHAAQIVLVIGLLQAACSSSDGKSGQQFPVKGSPDASAGGAGGDGAGLGEGSGGTDTESAGGSPSSGGTASVSSGGSANPGGTPGAGGKAAPLLDGGVPEGTERDAGTCTSDGDCSAPHRFCDVPSGRCVACLGDKHCPTGQTCGAGDHACKFACHTSGDCGDPQPYCDTAHSQCVACLSNTNCSAGTKNICDPTTRTCVECTADDDCSCLLLGQAPCCTASNRCTCGLLVCL